MQIGGFYVPYRNFFNSLKPRAWLDNQMMSLFVEKFNIENRIKTADNKRMKKKFSFSVQMPVSIIVVSHVFYFCCYGFLILLD